MNWAPSVSGLLQLQYTIAKWHECAEYFKIWKFENELETLFTSVYNYGGTVLQLAIISTHRMIASDSLQNKLENIATDPCSIVCDTWILFTLQHSWFVILVFQCLVINGATPWLLASSIAPSPMDCISLQIGTCSYIHDLHSLPTHVCFANLEAPSHAIELIKRHAT